MIIAGFFTAPDISILGILPVDTSGWFGTVAGAFVAFFAFIGFETLVNMAEEVKNPTRTVPMGIVGAIAASVVLYVMVALSVVLSGQTGINPLLNCIRR